MCRGMWWNLGSNPGKGFPDDTVLAPGASALREIGPSGYNEGHEAGGAEEGVLAPWRDRSVGPMLSRALWLPTSRETDPCPSPRHRPLRAAQRALALGILVMFRPVLARGQGTSGEAAGPGLRNGAEARPRGAELRQRPVPRAPLRAGGRGVRAVPEGRHARARRRRGPVRAGQRPAFPGPVRAGPAAVRGVPQGRARPSATPRPPGTGSARPPTCSATCPRRARPWRRSRRE